MTDDPMTDSMCVRCHGLFKEDLAVDTALMAKLMGRDEPEGGQGAAICDHCITGEEIRALAAARRADDPDS